MTTFNISGISSGIDTASVISNLLAVAAGPQNALQLQLNNTQTQLSAYQVINTKMAALKSAADTVALATTWAATTATSSDTSVVATGSATALAGTSTTFSVTQVAKAQVSTLGLSDPANAATAANGLDVTVGGTTTHLSLSGSSATDVASAINAAGLGLRAAVITTTTGTVLQLSGVSTGAVNSFSVTGLVGTPQTLATAQDAQIAVGDPANGGYTVNSTTNTFTDAIPGVTFTVSKPTADTTISVASDSASISAAITKLVAAANDALTTIGQATAKGAILEGDSTVTSLTQQILGVISGGTSTGQSFSIAGIDITSLGSVTFDGDSFAAAYASKPASVQGVVQSNLASKFSTVGAKATDSTTGSLTSLIGSDNSRITSLNRQISDWTMKLADQKITLQTKYAAMEATLSKLKSQSSYLTQMFNSMSGATGSSSSGSN